MVGEGKVVGKVVLEIIVAATKHHMTKLLIWEFNQLNSINKQFSVVNEQGIDLT
jgi:hypothetical protein